MLMDLGHRVYVDDFETHLLDSTAAYYRAKANALISTASCPEYLRKCEKWLNDELDRIRHCLDCSSENNLLRVVGKPLNLKLQVFRYLPPCCC